MQVIVMECLDCQKKHGCVIGSLKEDSIAYIGTQLRCDMCQHDEHCSLKILINEGMREGKCPTCEEQKREATAIQ